MLARVEPQDVRLALAGGRHLVLSLLQALALVLDRLLATVAGYRCPGQFPSLERRSCRVGPKRVPDEAHSFDVLPKHVIDIDIVLFGDLLQFGFSSAAAPEDFVAASAAHSFLAGLPLPGRPARVSSLHGAHGVPREVRWPQFTCSLLLVFDAVLVLQERFRLLSLLQGAPCARLHSLLLRLRLRVQHSRSTERIIAGGVLLNLIEFLCLPLKEPNMLLHSLQL